MKASQSVPRLVPPFYNQDRLPRASSEPQITSPRQENQEFVASPSPENTGIFRRVVGAVSNFFSTVSEYEGESEVEIESEADYTSEDEVQELSHSQLSREQQSLRRREKLDDYLERSWQVFTPQKSSEDFRKENCRHRVEKVINDNIKVIAEDVEKSLGTKGVTQVPAVTEGALLLLDVFRFGTRNTLANPQKRERIVGELAERLDQFLGQVEQSQGPAPQESRKQEYRNLSNRFIELFLKATVEKSNEFEVGERSLRKLLQEFSDEKITLKDWVNSSYRSIIDDGVSTHWLGGKLGRGASPLTAGFLWWNKCSVLIEDHKKANPEQSSGQSSRLRDLKRKMALVLEDLKKDIQNKNNELGLIEGQLQTETQALEEKMKRALEEAFSSLSEEEFSEYLKNSLPDNLQTGGVQKLTAYEGGLGRILSDTEKRLDFVKSQQRGLSGEEDGSSFLSVLKDAWLKNQQRQPIYEITLDLEAEFKKEPFSLILCPSQIEQLFQVVFQSFRFNQERAEEDFKTLLTQYLSKSQEFFRGIREKIITSQVDLRKLKEASAQQKQPEQLHLEKLRANLKVEKVLLDQMEGFKKEKDLSDFLDKLLAWRQAHKDLKLLPVLSGGGAEKFLSRFKEFAEDSQNYLSVLIEGKNFEGIQAELTRLERYIEEERIQRSSDGKIIYKYSNNKAKEKFLTELITPWISDHLLPVLIKALADPASIRGILINVLELASDTLESNEKAFKEDPAGYYLQSIHKSAKKLGSTPVESRGVYGKLIDRLVRKLPAKHLWLAARVFSFVISSLLGKEGSLLSDGLSKLCTEGVAAGLDSPYCEPGLLFHRLFDVIEISLQSEFEFDLTTDAKKEELIEKLLDRSDFRTEAEGQWLNDRLNGKIKVGELSDRLLKNESFKSFFDREKKKPEEAAPEFLEAIRKELKEADSKKQLSESIQKISKIATSSIGAHICQLRTYTWSTVRVRVLRAWEGEGVLATISWVFWKTLELGVDIIFFNPLVNLASYLLGFFLESATLRVSQWAGAEPFSKDLNEMIEEVLAHPEEMEKLLCDAIAKLLEEISNANKIEELVETLSKEEFLAGLGPAATQELSERLKELFEKKQRLQDVKSPRVPQGKVRAQSSSGDAFGDSLEGLVEVLNY